MLAAGQGPAGPAVSSGFTSSGLRSVDVPDGRSAAVPAVPATGRRSGPKLAAGQRELAPPGEDEDEVDGNRYAKRRNNESLVVQALTPEGLGSRQPPRPQVVFDGPRPLLTKATIGERHYGTGDKPNFVEIIDEQGRSYYHQRLSNADATFIMSRPGIALQSPLLWTLARHDDRYISHPEAFQLDMHIKPAPGQEFLTGRDMLHSSVRYPVLGGWTVGQLLNLAVPGSGLVRREIGRAIIRASMDQKLLINPDYPMWQAEVHCGNEWSPLDLVLQFPDLANLVEHSGDFSLLRVRLHVRPAPWGDNFVGHGEYRNKYRNELTHAPLLGPLTGNMTNVQRDNRGDNICTASKFSPGFPEVRPEYLQQIYETVLGNASPVRPRTPPPTAPSVVVRPLPAAVLPDIVPAPCQATGAEAARLQMSAANTHMEILDDVARAAPTPPPRVAPRDCPPTANV